MLNSDNLGYQLNWPDFMLITTYTSAIDDGMFSSTHFRSSSCKNNKITGMDQTQENQPDPHKFCLRLAQPTPELNEHNRMYHVTNCMFISMSHTRPGPGPGAGASWLGKHLVVTHHFVGFDRSIGLIFHASYLHPL